MLPNYKTIDHYLQEVALSSDVRSDDSGNLKYLSNKVLFVSKNGSFTIIDNAQNRLKKLNKSLEKWEEIIKIAVEFTTVRAYQVGLNYKPGKTWKQRDITDYIEKVKNYVGSENFVSYAWVAEMQKRLEVHYHAEIITTKTCRKVPMPDKKGHWKSGGSNRDEVSCVSINYLTSDYMKKKEQKSHYPKGIRIYSVWLNEKYFDATDFWALRSVSYPCWLVENINNAGLINPKIRRAAGGGWLVKPIGGVKEYFWKNDEGVILAGKEAEDFLKLEKYKYPMHF